MRWLGYVEFVSQNEWPYFQFSASQLIQHFAYEAKRESKKRNFLTHIETVHFNGREKDVYGYFK